MPHHAPIHVQQCYIGQHRLSYTQQGDGPPLLLIHGFSASRTWWQRNLPVLAQHHTVYAVDLVGFGQSRRQIPLSLHDTATLLAQFIERLGVQHTDVIAHSMGGLIALLLAAHYPQRVGRMVLAAAAGGAAMGAGLGEMSLRALSASLFCTPTFIPTIAWDGLRAGPVALLQAAAYLLHTDPMPHTQQVRAPILLVWGAQDTLVPPWIGHLYKAALPQAELIVLPKAGHVVMVDQAAHFNQLALDFLAHGHPSPTK